MAVDPAAPTASPQQVSSGPISSKALNAIGHGVFDAIANTVSDLHTRTIIYAQDNKLWKVSAFKAGGLAITQLSSEAEANSICQTITATDLSNHDNAAYVYELAGTDGDCNQTSDNLWRMVRIGMDSSTAPFSAKQPITSIDNSISGAHKGWLVDEGKTLKFFSADFSSSKNVLDTNGQPVSYTISMDYYGPINILQEVLRLDGAIGTYTVEDDEGNGNIWKPRASVITNYADSHIIADSSYLYFADPEPGNQNNMIIYRDKLTDDAIATTALTRLNNFDAENDQLILKTTSNKLILAWHQQSTNITLVAAMDKATGELSGVTKLTGAEVNSSNIRSLITNGDKLYYSFALSAAYLTDGTNENYTTDNPPTPNLSSGNFTNSTSAWIGALQSNQSFIGNSPQPETLFLAEGFIDSTNGFSGGSLTRYDAATAAKGNVLGNIPAGIKEVQIEGNRAITLSNGLRSDDHNDIFFVDVDTANSLTRITDDATDEIIIDAYH
jgi:hypothetical protein